MISAAQMRVGMIINYNGSLCRVTSLLRQAVGRGSGKVVTKLKNLQTGSNVEHRFRSDEKVEPVRIESLVMEYLYTSSAEYVFMNTENYEQISLNEEMVQDIKDYLLPNAKYTIEFNGENPIGILPPRTLDLKIVETEPGIKGATASASMKPATLETGLVVGVPPFVEVGTVIRIDTSEKKYLERVS
ncbi:elongation factor P [candidate division KSB1 bacterium]|nr:elongation factor P [candidate division KSB1 bacterium]